MKKKIFSIVLVLALVLQTAVFVFADETDIPEVHDSYNVDIDMQVKKSTSSSWVNGPVTKKTNEKTNFDFRAIMDTSAIKQAIIDWCSAGYYEAKKLDELFPGNKPKSFVDTLMDKWSTRTIDGEFTISIAVPSGVVIPSEMRANSHNMYGFTESIKASNGGIFHETNRTFANNVLEITIAPNAPGNAEEKLRFSDLIEEPSVSDEEMKIELSEYFYDFELECKGVAVSAVGTYTVIGDMNGSVQFETMEGLTNPANVSFIGVQKKGGENDRPYENVISATVKVEKSSSPSSSGGGGGGIIVDPTKTNITLNIDGEIIEIDASKGAVKGSQLPKPSKPGYMPSSWFFDKEFTQEVAPYDTVPAGSQLYARWISEMLNNDDHIAYIKGYPEGDVRPENNISREEVATVFFRLLRENVRNQNWAETNAFPDVEDGRWSNIQISTMANGGFVTGYEDGYFRPEAYITRAEFATIACRFANLTDEGEIKFNDIAGHWAESSIRKAYVAGWINGYEDGSFKPEQYITRAEAMAIINRVLFRQVNEEGLHPDAIRWPDMKKSDWYYYIVEEATNDHLFVKQEDGKNETWTFLPEFYIEL